MGLISRVSSRTYRNYGTGQHESEGQKAEGLEGQRKSQESQQQKSREQKGQNDVSSKKEGTSGVAQTPGIAEEEHQQEERGPRDLRGQVKGLELSLDTQGRGFGEAEHQQESFEVNEFS